MSDTAEILDQAARWRADGHRASRWRRWSRPGAPRRGRPAPSSRSATAARLSARYRAAASRARSIGEAQEVIRDGKPRLLDFGISDDQAWEVGLACGGKIAIFVERVE